MEYQNGDGDFQGWEGAIKYTDASFADPSALGFVEMVCGLTRGDDGG